MATCPHVVLGTLYNRYIGVEELLSIWHSGTNQTVDEALVRSHLFSLILWRRVEERELHALLDLIQNPLALEVYQEAVKRIERCLVVDEMLLQQGEIVWRNLFQEHPHFGFRLWPLPEAPLWETVTELTSQLAQYLGPYRLGNSVEDDLVQQQLKSQMRARFLEHRERIERIQRQTDALLQWLSTHPTATPVSFDELVPVEDVLALSYQTIQKYHHSSLNTDILSFIIIHQIFELWFATALVAMKEAIAFLHGEPPHILNAGMSAQVLAEVLQLCAVMIVYPQTMTAADYFVFRGEIKDSAPGGSGAESEQFRALEILMGLRDPQYRLNLQKIHMLAPHFEDLFAQPSLKSSFMELVQRQGIVAGDDSDEEIAIKLCTILRPTGEINSHTDLAGLAEALLDSEQALDRWRHVHIGMVDRLMGGQRESIGIAGEAADGKKDSKAFLLKTLRYQRIFKPLFDARNHLTADKQQQMS